MCINFDVNVAWIASALHYTGFSTTIGLAMTVVRCVAAGCPRQFNCIDNCEANGIYEAFSL
ncbi:MAG: hypothetical protein FWC76_04790 [Defluviitaleaceae bacterium]|nr:hypothetical protein [Defluviitaleaceae bacterium]